MIDLDTYEIFRVNKTTLKETSKDASERESVQYMTDSPIEVVDFDKVKRHYANHLHLSEECAASVDALVKTEENLLMIEFKNGKVNNRNVKDKVRDSLLFFCDITGKNISYTRENLEFIVVYNQEKNPLPNQLKKQTARTIQDSPSREAIGKYFLKKGNEEFIRFDLERYKRLYFREVHTYSPEEFDEYMKEIAGK